jgi:hypothetical protein
MPLPMEEVLPYVALAFAAMLALLLLRVIS